MSAAIEAWMSDDAFSNLGASAAARANDAVASATRPLTIAAMPANCSKITALSGPSSWRRKACISVTRLG